ncbi:MAG: hypothetical protein LUC23_02275 [Prevotellaceae bacterium]|nr:hypothetical protein [Prevotellaceae bacterium]
MKGFYTVIVGWGVYFLAALGCGYLFGNFPVAWFAFPVNVASWLLWAAVWWLVWRRWRGCLPVRMLVSVKSSLLLLFLFFATCLVYGLDGRAVAATWWIVALLWALTSHLLVVLYNGVGRPRRYKWRFILIHSGLLLALLGGFLGVPDRSEWQVVLETGRPVRGVVDQRGNVIKWKHTVEWVNVQDTAWKAADAAAATRPQWRDVTTETDVYAARLLIDGRKRVVLRVNHPYRMSWQDDLYLVDMIPDGSHHGLAGCVLTGVRQPWKYVEWAGIWLLIAGCVLLFVQGVTGSGKEAARGGDVA